MLLNRCGPEIPLPVGGSVSCARRSGCSATSCGSRMPAAWMHLPPRPRAATARAEEDPGDGQVEADVRRVVEIGDILGDAEPDDASPVVPLQPDRAWVFVADSSSSLVLCTVLLLAYP